MELTQPEVFLIGGPIVYSSEVERYLQAVDPTAVEWLERFDGPLTLDDGEMLTEFAGRLCYRSWKEGLNKNVTKIRKESKEYFANILSSRHGSVLEHATYNFVFHNVSRVFTHELITHRVGMAKSQESLRFVRLDHIGFRIPDILEPMKDEILEIVERLEEFQVNAAEKMGLDQPGLPFAKKKKITSALRRLAPDGLSTGVMWSANLRTLRFCVEARTDEGAEEEIRMVFDQVGRLMQERCPNVFQDFERTPNGAWVPENRKV